MEPIDPPFRSFFERGAFAFALLAALALPALLDGLGRPTLRDRLRSVPSTDGDFASIERVILDEKEDLDVLVLGTSYLWAAIDSPWLAEQLSAERGRPVTVRTVGSNFRGEEMYFVLLGEILARRKVGTLILSMPGVKDRRDAPHPYAHRVAGPGFASIYAGLPLRQRAAAYGVALLGASRHGLSLVRGERQDASSLVATNGALLRSAGFSGAPFEKVDAEPPTLPASELRFGAGSRAHFCFRDDPLNEIQQHFTEKTLALAHAHGVRVVVVEVPTWGDRLSDDVAGIAESERWPACVGERMPWPEMWPGVELVGVPARTLFGGMSEERAKLFFYSSHLNTNGARYFTKALYPALAELVR